MSLKTTPGQLLFNRYLLITQHLFEHLFHFYLSVTFSLRQRTSHSQSHFIYFYLIGLHRKINFYQFSNER